MEFVIVPAGTVHGDIRTRVSLPGAAHLLAEAGPHTVLTKDS